MEKKSIAIVGKGETWKVYEEDILFIRQEGKELTVCTRWQLIRRPGNIQSWTGRLGTSFYRCHRYCLVNFDRVFGMKNQEVYFENGQSVTMGINQFRKTRQAFLDYVKIACNFKGVIV